MSTRKLHLRGRAGVLAFVFTATFVTAPLPARAAMQSPETSAPPGPAPQAPVVRFDAAGITLEEAVRLTLQHEPTIKRQEAALQSQEGVLQEQSGLFDTALNGTTSYAYTRQDLTESEKVLAGASTTASRDGGFTVQLDKPFRSGLILSPFADLAYQGLSYGGVFVPGVSSPPNLFTSHSGLSLLVPLARGRGIRATDAPEKAASYERDAARLDLRHQAEVSALATIAAYWDVRAAQESAAITARTVDTQARLAQLTKELIDAGELPRADIARAQAAEARARAQLADAKGVVHQARVALAIAMGVAVTSDDATLPRARDEFPHPPDAPLLADAQVTRLADRAIADRPDVAAAAARERAGTTLEQGAQWNVRPRVDLAARLYATARDESRAFQAWSGPSTEVSLQAERPLGNNVLRGQLVQRQAELNEAHIGTADLRRQIALNVIQAAGSLEQTSQRVRDAEASVGFFRSTIDAELERFKVGESTLIDTVLTQQQQTDSELALVAAQRELAGEIARLRFEAGLLLPNGAVAAPNFTTVPVAPGR